MTSDKKTLSRPKQDKQLMQLLKDFGITGKIPELSQEERKKVDKLFPE
jgi:hypothetical protein